MKVDRETLSVGVVIVVLGILALFVLLAFFL